MIRMVGCVIVCQVMFISASAQNDTLKIFNKPDTVRISEINNQHENLTGAELKAADFSGLSFPIPGTKARIGFGGFLKLDAIADFSGTGDKYEFVLDKIQIPAEGGFQRDGYFFMNARETRFYLDFRNITKSGIPLRVFTEMDFWFKENSDFRVPIRMRHFYAVYNNLTIGYTWGTVTDPLSWPNTIDFSGEIINGSRRAVVRWEQPGILPGAKWAVSLENDFFPVIYNPYNLEGVSSPRFPVLAARINQRLGKHPNGHWMLGAQIRELRWDGPTKNSTAISWVAAFSGRVYLDKSDFFSWNFSIGDGLAGNTSTLLSSNESAVLTAAEKVEPVFATQGTLGFTHYFTRTLAMSLDIRGLKVERHSDFPDIFMRKGGQGHINLIWSPWQHINTGIEYMFGSRTNMEDDKGNAHRAQCMIKFIF